MDVALRFGERRNAAVALNHLRACVVSGEREGKVAVITIEKIFDVAGAAVDILRGIENIGDGILRGSFRNQLHQAESVFGRNRFRIEI